MIIWKIYATGYFIVKHSHLQYIIKQFSDLANGWYWFIFQTLANVHTKLFCPICQISYLACLPCDRVTKLNDRIQHNRLSHWLHYKLDHTHKQQQFINKSRHDGLFANWNVLQNLRRHHSRYFLYPVTFPYHQIHRL